MLFSLMINVTLFSQIISRLYRKGFGKLVKERQTDKHQKGYNSWTHLVSMLFCRGALCKKPVGAGHLERTSRRVTGNLNHLGINKAPSKSTISYQNKHRDWELFREYYYHLLKRLGQQGRFFRHPAQGEPPIHRH